jgi:hypothetical protein
MTLRAYLRALALRLLHGSELEGDLDEELRSHIHFRADDLERSGLTRVEAERRARIEFGGRERFKEESRAALGGDFIDTLARDMRYSLRILRKSPWFTAAAILILAFSIGSNLAVFRLIDALMLRSIPVTKPEELVKINPVGPEGRMEGMPSPVLDVLRRQSLLPVPARWK